MEKAREFQENIYFCFIDYAKAFDCVDHNKLWKILKEMRIPDHLTCLLRNLCADQEATVGAGHGTTDWFQVGKEVCQGCILSPCLFNLYAEYIMRDTIHGVAELDTTEQLNWIRRAAAAAKSLQSCPTLSDPMDCSPPGSSIHGIFQATVLEWGARLPCLSPTPGAYSKSRPSRRWCHPTILSSVVPFSSRFQSFPASGSFPMSQFFTSGGQSIGVSASHQFFQWIFRIYFP